MKKEDIMNLGVDEDTASKLAEALKSYVPYERFKEVVDEKNKLKADVKERDGQLESLKKSNDDVDSLKKQIEDFKEANKAKDEAHAKEIRQLKVDKAVETSLLNAKARNNKAVRSLLSGLDEAEFDNEGNIKGLDKQIKALMESDPYLFENDTSNSFKGAMPGEASDDEKSSVDISKMTYSQLAEYMANNPGVKID